MTKGDSVCIAAVSYGGSSKAHEPLEVVRYSDGEWGQYLTKHSVNSDGD